MGSGVSSSKAALPSQLELNKDQHDGPQKAPKRVNKFISPLTIPSGIVIEDSKQTPKSAEVVFSVMHKANQFKQRNSVAIKNFRKHFRKKGVLTAAHTLKLHQAAQRIEPKVTKLLKKLADEFQGKLVGLEHRFKTIDSLEQKVERDIHEANLKMLDDMSDQREQGEKKRRSSSSNHLNTVKSTLQLFDESINIEESLEEEIKNSPIGYLLRKRSLLNSIISIMPLEEGTPTTSPSDNKQGNQSSPQAMGTLKENESADAAELESMIPTTPSKLSKAQLQQQLSLTSPKGASLMQRMVSTEESSEQRLFKSEKHASMRLDKEALEMEESNKEIENNTVKKNIDVGKLVWDISDALRYTVLLDLDKYTNGVKRIMDQLKKNNIHPVSMKNFWPSGDGYQGINNVFGFKCKESPTGILKIEIQFHTADSFEQKMSSHGLYEKFRATIDPDLKMEIFKECCRSADEVPVPEGVLSIPHLKVRAGIFLENLHVNLLLARAISMKDKALNQVERLCTALSVWDTCEPKIRANLLSRSAVELRLKHEVRKQTLSHETLEGLIPESELFKKAVMSIYDSLVINIILPYDHYSIATALIMTRLFGESVLRDPDSDSNRNDFFREVKSYNAWKLPASFNASGVSGGVGIVSYVTMEGEDDGVAFTPDDAYPLVISFHTVESYRAVLTLQATQSEFRGANTSEQRRAALRRAKGAVQAVKVPLGARMLLAE